jgi:hypothetical protein
MVPFDWMTGSKVHPVLPWSNRNDRNNAAGEVDTRDSPMLDGRPSCEGKAMRRIFQNPRSLRYRMNM